MSGRIECFPPVARADAKLLILGTMPSVESLRQSFYYSHPRNAFWPIMAELFRSGPLATAEEKTALLISRRIALWDVAQSCEREGSLDSAMRSVLPNDFASLYARCPGIQKILFNGNTAAKLYSRLVGFMPEDCVCACVPSTSPAYTRPFAEKLEKWRLEMEMIL